MLGGARSWPSSLSRLHAPEARASGASRVHQPDLFGLRGHRAERFVGSLALLPGVWDESAPRPQRRAEHPVAGASAQWAGIRPSDANVARWGVRSPRTRGALAPAECQPDDPTNLAHGVGGCEQSGHLRPDRGISIRSEVRGLCRGSAQRDTEQWTALLSPAALLSGDVWQHAGAPRRELGLRRRTRQLPDHDAARPGRAHAARAARQRIVHRYAALSEPDARVVRRGALKRQAGAGERRASQKGLYPVTTFTRRPGT